MTMTRTEALDILAAEPAPAPMLYPCITTPKRLPDEWLVPHARRYS